MLLDIKSKTSKYVILSLISIGVTSFLIRIYYYPYEIPLTRDAFHYFLYSVDINYLGHLPTNWSPSNNGWPSFVALFFPFFQFDSMLLYMQIPRLLSILLSILTIIPIYFLCKRFTDSHFAIVGVAIFAFDPRIILNSLLGITEPSYILLGAIALILFLNSNKKITYVAFGVTALTTLVRAEGLFFFVTLTILFFIRYRQEKLVIPKYLVALAIFLLIITPMSLYRIDVTGVDGIFIRTLYPGLSYDSQSISDPAGPSATGFVNALSLFFSYLGWIMIPNLIFFVPVGSYLILQKRNFEKLTIILVLGIMSLPALAAYSIPAQDTRYLYPLYPMFCILAALAIQRYTFKFKNKQIILFLIIIGILASSLIFYEYKKIDYNHEIESFEIAKKIVIIADGVNSYPPENAYLNPALMEQNWPTSQSLKPINFTIISTKNYDSLKEYIQESKPSGLTHIVVDDSNKRPSFLIDVFNHPEKYPYLKQVFDSKGQYNYHLKIFEIEYERFDSTEPLEHIKQ